MPTRPTHASRASRSRPQAMGEWIELLRTLADPMRLRILRLLEQAAHPGLRVGELSEALKLPQSTVSRHIKTLLDAGLVDGHRDGTSMLYCLSEMAGRHETKQLRALTRESLVHDEQIQADAARLAQVLRRRHTGGHEFFDAKAPHWDALRKEWFGDTFHLEAMLAGLNPDWTVGDLGAGTGAMFTLLAPHVKTIIAVEPSAAMLKAAKARIKTLGLNNVELLQGRLESLPIPEQTLDMAIISLVLHYVDDIPAVLTQTYRTLKPGGVLLILDLLAHSVEMFRKKMGHRWMGFAPHTLEEQLSAAGFVQTRWHTLPARAGRSREAGVTIPDLFVMRAVRPR
ncbi:MAG TPA: metalloregulator ArsR/SmtB family transcription factor [Phycisphaerae bacterium]|nr:metalloregulator ArsR/SmtB family transcription factor [Phycisphaerae bacterium]